MIITEEMKKMLQESLNDRWKTPTGEPKGGNKTDKNKKRKRKPKGKEQSPK